MSKPREFWANPDADYRTDHIVTKEEYNEFKEEFPKGPEWILVREVREIDWDKIFEELNAWSSRFVLEQFSWQDKLRELVEAQLKGES